jgi:hypothetical protein
MIALVIFRKVNDKVLIHERSYLYSDTKTLYPALMVTNADDLYNLTKEMSNKYNISFPTDNGKTFII